MKSADVWQPLTYLPHRAEQVLEALQRGEVLCVEEAIEQVPDFFMLYAIESGLLDQLTTSFPDPRTQQPEIPMRIILAAGLAGHFAGLYGLSTLPYALHSPRLLSELGVQVRVTEPGEGISRRGTQQKSAFHGDVVRKLLEQIANTDTKAQRLPTEAQRLPGQSMIDWYNEHVGSIYCRAADAQPCVHILDCTHLTVNIKNDRYEQSGVTSRQEYPGAPVTSERGYKLGTLRSLLDDGAVMTAIAWGSIEQHDLMVTHDLVRHTPHLHSGDILLEDRGFIDADTINHLKTERGVDVYTGLKRDMVLLRGAIAQAEGRPGDWCAHPTRPEQEIQRVTDLGSLWVGLTVALNVCVVRFKDKKTKQWRYIGFATTDLTASARRIIQTYQTRPEIEEDYRQLKSRSWCLERFTSTRLVQIIWHVILVLLSYNLMQVYAHTTKGSAFAGKTKQRIEREQAASQETHLLVCTHEAFGVYKTKELLYLMLGLPDDIRDKIRKTLMNRRE